MVHRFVASPSNCDGLASLMIVFFACYLILRAVGDIGGATYSLSYLSIGKMRILSIVTLFDGVTSLSALIER